MEQIGVKEILEAVGGVLLCGDESTPLAHVSIDSRNIGKGDLFVPLPGEQVDGHRFISQALERGGAAVLTSQHHAMEGEKAWIRVEDTFQALQDLGTYCRNRLSLPLVGITGSVGKTTTREMTAWALSAGFRVFKTPANYNSQVGVPITLSEISAKDQVGVLELGMSRPGEMSVIARMARIQMGVITNVGVTHMEQLGSQENIYREKLSIQDGMEEGGTLFLNGDDPLLKKARARKGIETIYYGSGENCDYRAVDLEFQEGFPVFTAVHGQERARVRLKVLGSHNVGNAMVSLAVASQMGIPMAEAAKCLGQFTGFQGRQQVWEKDGITVIDDSYNASPPSMKAGIQVLGAMGQAGRRIAVLADMKELGEESPRFHYEIGAFLASWPISQLVTLGEMAREMARGARENCPAIQIHEFLDREALAGYLAGELRAGDFVLFKGSNSMGLGQVSARFLPKEALEASHRQTKDRSRYGAEIRQGDHRHLPPTGGSDL